MASLVRMQQRRDTTAGWTSANPVLASGELAYNTTTGTLRIGDGVTAWASLVDVTFRGDGLTSATVTALGAGGAPGQHDISDNIGGIQTVSTGGIRKDLIVSVYGTSGGALHFNYASGTAAAPGAVAQGDTIVSIGCRAWDGTGFNGSSIALVGSADESSSGRTYVGSYLIIGTTANGSGTRSNCMMLDQSGFVGIGPFSSVTRPAALLHVLGATTATLQIDTTSGAVTDIARIAFARGSTNKWQVGINISGTGDAFQVYSNTLTAVVLGLNLTTGLATLSAGLTTGGDTTASKNQNATTTIAVSNTDTTSNSSRGQFLATGGTVVCQLIALHTLRGQVGTTSVSDFAIATGGNVAVTFNGTTGLPVFIGGMALDGGTAPSHGVQFGTSAPAVLADGQLWYDGTNFKVRTGGATKTVTIT